MSKLVKKDRNCNPPLTSHYSSYKDMINELRSFGDKTWLKARHWKKGKGKHVEGHYGDLADAYLGY